MRAAVSKALATPAGQHRTMSPPRFLGFLTGLLSQELVELVERRELREPSCFERCALNPYCVTKVSSPVLFARRSVLLHVGLVRSVLWLFTWLLVFPGTSYTGFSKPSVIAQQPADASDSRVSTLHRRATPYKLQRSIDGIIILS
jgi:hypothetical protein